MLTKNKTVRVLYTDDDRDSRLLVARKLRAAGYDVALADNGKTGVLTAVNWRPHVILIDACMPLMNGPEAIRAVLSNPECSHIPIFVITAYTDEYTTSACLNAGARGVLQKPTDFEQLSLIIQETIRPRVAEYDRTH